MLVFLDIIVVLSLSSLYLSHQACYLEDVAHVKTFIHDEITASRPPRVIVNTEWGAFGDNGVLDPWRTRYDRVLDRSSRNPGKQIFEKMVSGMYLGEIVRLIMLDAVEKKILFQKEPKAAKQLRTPDIFDAKVSPPCHPL